MAKMKSISSTVLNRMTKEIMADDKARILRRALDKNDINTISSVMEVSADTENQFSINLKTMNAVSQNKSGRCWLFAACNFMREIIAKKYDIPQFEISQNYLAFYDKLEKCNYYMETVLQELDSPYADETLRYVMETAVGDGGQWDMLTSIVKKYGICPKSAMRETFQSSNTFGMTRLLNQRLRKFTYDTKELYKKGKIKEIAKAKDECLKDCYSLCVTCFGVPPKSFTFEYTDSKGKYHAIDGITPADFYKKYLKTDLDDYVGIINGPTKDKPFYHTFTVKYLGNVVDGDAVNMLNLPMDDFKKAIIAQLKDGLPVWFGCDCGKDGNREIGIWDDKQYDYSGTFGIDFSMSKEAMLDTRNSAMNHAMLITGVNIKAGKSTKWKIENSWGDKIANQGYFVASDSWFDKYTYQAVVNKKYLNAKALKALEEEPIVLQPWDPFGTLAD